MCRKLNDITNMPVASTYTTILPTIRILDLLIAFTSPNLDIPYKNSKYCVKISFWFTISQSILFKAITGHSSLSIEVYTHTHTLIYKYVHVFIIPILRVYTASYSFFCIRIRNEIESNFTLPPNCQKLTSSCQSIKCQLCAVSDLQRGFDEEE